MDVPHFPGHGLGFVEVGARTRDQPHACKIGLRSDPTDTNSVVAAGSGDAGTGGAVIVRIEISIRIDLEVIRLGIVILPIPVVLKFLDHIRSQIGMAPLHAVIHDADDHSTAADRIVRADGWIIPDRLDVDIGALDRALLALVFQVPLELDEGVVRHCFLGGEGGEQRGGIRRGHLLSGQHPKGGGGGGGFVNKGVWGKDRGFLEFQPLGGGEDIRLGAAGGVHDHLARDDAAGEFIAREACGVEDEFRLGAVLGTGLFDGGGERLGRGGGWDREEA